MLGSTYSLSLMARPKSPLKPERNLASGLPLREALKYSKSCSGVILVGVYSHSPRTLIARTSYSYQVPSSLSGGSVGKVLSGAFDFSGSSTFPVKIPSFSLRG